MYDICWFSRKFPLNIDKNAIYELWDVDLIVKLMYDKIILFNDNQYHKLAFLTDDGKILYGEYKGLIDYVEINDVLKLRSISIIK